jgi:hypothetical protein
MIELITMLFTSGGSAMLGSMLKGVFGAINENRRNKFELELARECRSNEFALTFQKQLSENKDGSYVQHTRRLLACIGMLTLSAITLISTIWPSVPILSTESISGAEGTSLFWGIVNFPNSGNLVVTTGHASLVAVTSIYPLILGFYFTPAGSR